MGDTECAAEVLEGTYEYPEGIDEATKMLLEECLKMYLSMSREEVATYVTAEDYQYYWKRVKEKTSLPERNSYITSDLSKLDVLEISEE